MNLSIRPLTAADFPLLLTWLAKSHVKAWWDDGDDTLEKVAHHYGDQSATNERFILLHQGEAATEPRPIGYLQYEVDDGDSVSIDQFIGEEELLSQGIGTLAIQLLLAYVIDHHQPRQVTVDPAPANRRAIRCYEKVGFQFDPALQSPTGVDAYMMKIEM